MSKGKYVVPVVMGKPVRELYFVKGHLPRDQKIGLARLVSRRGFLESDKAGMSELSCTHTWDYQYPQIVNELELVKDSRDVKLSTRMTLEGFMNNSVNSKAAIKELNDWYLFERNGDLTPLPLAKFSINLLERDEKNNLLRSVR